MCLKLDDGEEMYKNLLPRFIHLFVMGKDALYAKANMQNYAILMYHEAHCPRLHQLFLRNVNLFNSECGEISFSVLSRCTLGDTMKAADTHMDRMYKLTKEFRLPQLSKDFNVDLDYEERSTGSNFGGHEWIANDAEEVRGAAAFLRSAMRSMEANTFEHYEPNRGNNWQNAATARRFKTSAAFPRIYTPLQKEVFERLAKEAGSMVSAYWVYTFGANIVPASMPLPQEGEEMPEGEKVLSPGGFERLRAELRAKPARKKKAKADVQREKASKRAKPNKQPRPAKQSEPNTDSESEEVMPHVDPSCLRDKHEGKHDVGERQAGLWTYDPIPDDEEYETLEDRQLREAKDVAGKKRKSRPSSAAKRVLLQRLDAERDSD